MRSMTRTNLLNTVAMLQAKAPEGGSALAELEDDTDGTEDTEDTDGDEASDNDDTETPASDVPAATVKTATVHVREAKTFAGKITAAFDKLVSALIVAKNKFTRGPIPVLDQLAGIFGDDLKAWPVPGSEDTKATPTNNPDRMKVPSPKNLTVLVPTSFYATVYDNMPQGLEVIRRKDWLKECRDGNPSEGNPYKFKRGDDIGIQNEVDGLTTDRSTGIAILRKAMTLYHQRLAVTEMGFKVIWNRMKDEKGNLVLRNTPKLIKVTDPNDTDANPAFFSIGSFLGLDTVKATEAGGTFEALCASGRKRDGDNDDKNPVPDVTIKNLYNATVKYLAFFSDASNMAALAKAVDPKAKGAKELLVAVGDLKGELNAFMTDGRSKRYAVAIERSTEQAS